VCTTEHVSSYLPIRIVLLAHRGKSDADIVDALSTSKPTVERVRRLFCTEGLYGGLVRRACTEGLYGALYDKKRPGRTARITGEEEAKLTMLACSSPPDGRKRWTLQGSYWQARWWSLAWWSLAM
jgi:Homeodomain-like domain